MMLVIVIQYQHVCHPLRLHSTGVFWTASHPSTRSLTLQASHLPTLALTDTYALYGAMDFVFGCRQAASRLSSA
jgi:hypothetical protein